MAILNIQMELKILLLVFMWTMVSCALSVFIRTGIYLEAIKFITFFVVLFFSVICYCSEIVLVA